MTLFFNKVLKNSREDFSKVLDSPCRDLSWGRGSAFPSLPRCAVFLAFALDICHLFHLLKGLSSLKNPIHNSSTEFPKLGFCSAFSRYPQEMLALTSQSQTAPPRNILV